MIKSSFSSISSASCSDVLSPSMRPLILPRSFSVELENSLERSCSSWVVRMGCDAFLGSGVGLEEESGALLVIELDGFGSSLGRVPSSEGVSSVLSGVSAASTGGLVSVNSASPGFEAISGRHAGSEPSVCTAMR
ncbi:hypothetical protein CC2G_000432 [Coprinopsis cinerea AmutBmut pab1-1]|nr:hypothetical protein CC2G_000432 [Coprinopsis cinerea AmutBmut pab1-1]